MFYKIKYQSAVRTEPIDLYSVTLYIVIRYILTMYQDIWLCENNLNQCWKKPENANFKTKQPSYLFLKPSSCCGNTRLSHIGLIRHQQYFQKWNAIFDFCHITQFENNVPSNSFWVVKSVYLLLEYFWYALWLVIG